MKGIFKSRLILTGVALVLLGGALAVAVLSSAHSHPARAYGKANWQIGFSGTAVTPGTGQGSGFWGWCDFGGGVTSGNTGDCQISEYLHTPGGNLHCEVSYDATSWDIGPNGTFVIETGTVTVHTSPNQTATCLAVSALPADTGLPAKAGHYNFTSLFLAPGQRGTFQIQVTQIP